MGNSVLKTNKKIIFYEFMSVITQQEPKYYGFSGWMEWRVGKVGPPNEFLEALLPWKALKILISFP